MEMGTCMKCEEKTEEMLSDTHVRKNQEQWKNRDKTRIPDILRDEYDFQSLINTFFIFIME